MSSKSTRTSGSARGFTLVETIIALFLIGLAVLAAAPMFMYATRVNTIGADFGSEGAMAVERMEELRQTNYSDLTPGGSLTANNNGYFDDSDETYTLRWQIVNNVNPANTKTLRVRCIATRTVAVNGQAKSVTLTSLRGP